MEHFLLPGAENRFQDVMCISVCTPTLHFAPHRNQLQTINLRIKSMLYNVEIKLQEVISPVPSDITGIFISHIPLHIVKFNVNSKLEEFKIQASTVKTAHLELGPAPDSKLIGRRGKS